MSTSSSVAPSGLQDALSMMGIPPDALLSEEITPDDERIDAETHEAVRSESAIREESDEILLSLRLLPIVIKYGGEKLDQSLANPGALIDLLAKNPWLSKISCEVYQSGKYHRIRQLKCLRALSRTHDLPENEAEFVIELNEDEKATLASWKAEFRGTSADLVEHILNNNMKVMHHSARYLTHLQSSGTGKSRVHDELAKRILYIPLNLGSGNEHSYPPADPQVRKWFEVEWDVSGAISQKAFQDRCYAFLHALMLKTRDELIQITKEHSEKLIALEKDGISEDSIKKRTQLLASAFRDKMAKGGTFRKHGRYRSTFYEEVIKVADKNIRDMVLFKPDEDVFQTVAKEVTKILDLYNHLDEKPLVVICWDESHPLTEPVSDMSWTPFSELRGALRSIRNLPIFSVFLTTVGKIGPVSPSRPVEPSSRVFTLTLDTFSPITEVGFDEFAIKVDSTGSSTLSQVASTSHMAHLGRALFPTRYDNGNNGVKRSIVDFAMDKLLCRRTFSAHLSDAETLACLAVRLGLEFRGTAWTERQAELTQVERHMRLCLAATVGLHKMVTISPSEPLLAEAAQRTMATCLTPDQAAQALLDHIKNSYLNAGDRGELIAALLLLLSRDKVITSGYRKTPFPGSNTPLPNTLENNGGRKGRIVTVLELLDVLLPSDDARTSVRNQKPSRYTKEHGEQKLEDAFADGFIWFNHFIKVHDFDTMNREYLWRLISRGAAIICPNDQRGIDIVIPILFGDYLKLECISAILIRVKNDRSYTTTVRSELFEQMDPFRAGLFSKGEDPPFPIIRMVFALASKDSAVTQPLLPSTRSHSKDKYTAYDIWIAGVTHQSFGIIKDNSYGFAELLRRSSKSFDGYDVLDIEALPSLNQDRAGVRRTMNPGAATGLQHFKKYVAVDSLEVSPVELDDSEDVEEEEGDREDVMAVDPPAV